MAAGMAVVADRPQLPQELVADIGVGEVVNLGRRPGPAAFADATGSLHHGSASRLPRRGVEVLVILAPPVGPFPLLNADVALLDLVPHRRVLGVVAVSQRRVGIGYAVGVVGL